MYMKIPLRFITGTGILRALTNWILPLMIFLPASRAMDLLRPGKFGSAAKSFIFHPGMKPGLMPAFMHMIFIGILLKTPGSFKQHAHIPKQFTCLAAGRNK
jgi:hypothetical protein